LRKLFFEFDYGVPGGLLSFYFLSFKERDYKFFLLKFNKIFFCQ
jgi:hypothetical protein